MFKMKKPKAESKNIKSEAESGESIGVKVEAEDKKDREKEILKNQSKKSGNKRCTFIIQEK